MDTTHGTLDTGTRIPVSRQKKAGIQTKYPWIPGYQYSGNTVWDIKEGLRLDIYTNARRLRPPCYIV